MIVGKASSGKTTCYNILLNSINRLSESKQENCNHTIKHVINPKCINMGELYGEVDKSTGEWVDGLASNKIREANFWSDPKVHHWIIFDGPVDALWIENMNTVLDDNTTLCLANSERIKLKSQLRMIFEVEDL